MKKIIKQDGRSYIPSLDRYMTRAEIRREIRRVRGIITDLSTHVRVLKQEIRRLRRETRRYSWLLEED